MEEWSLLVAGPTELSRARERSHPVASDGVPLWVLPGTAVNVKYPPGRSAPDNAILIKTNFISGRWPTVGLWETAVRKRTWAGPSSTAGR